MNPDGERASGTLLMVVSGPTAAGKTTVGQRIALRRERAVHIDGDVIQGMVVSGAVRMDEPAPPGAMDQVRLRYRAALMIADVYRDAGFDVIISDNVFGREVTQILAAALRSRPSGAVCFVMLNPSVDQIGRRYAQRPGGGYTDGLTAAFLKAAVDRTPRVGVWLDNTGQTAAETVDAVLGRLDEARVSLQDLG